MGYMSVLCFGLVCISVGVAARPEFSSGDMLSTRMNTTGGAADDELSNTTTTKIVDCEADTTAGADEIACKMQTLTDNGGSAESAKEWHDCVVMGDPDVSNVYGKKVQG